MIHQVIVTPRARIDLLQTSRWLAERSPQAAARWLSGLAKVFTQLRENAGRQPIDQEASEQFGIVLRQKLYGRRGGTYRILFSIEGENVYIHHIRHAARGPIEP